MTVRVWSDVERRLRFSPLVASLGATELSETFARNSPVTADVYFKPLPLDLDSAYRHVKPRNQPSAFPSPHTMYTHSPRTALCDESSPPTALGALLSKRLVSKMSSRFLAFTLKQRGKGQVLCFTKVATLSGCYHPATGPNSHLDFDRGLYPGDNATTSTLRTPAVTSFDEEPNSHLRFVKMRVPTEALLLPPAILTSPTITGRR